MVRKMLAQMTRLTLLVIILNLTHGQDSDPSISCFSGRGYILNRLANRPITSTEEEVQLLFRTSNPDSYLFTAGSEDQSLSINLRNGWLQLSLLLPDHDSDSLATQVIQTGHPPTRSRTVSPWSPSRASRRRRRLLQLKAEVRPGQWETSRLDDNQWHTLVLSRSSNRVRLMVDNQPLLDRWLEPGRKNSNHLLRTQVIALGGPMKMDETQYLGRASSGITGLRLFKGHMLQARLKADGLEMDILKYTKTGQHGFKVHSPGFTNDATTIQFHPHCTAIPVASESTPTASAISFRNLHFEEAYLALALPPPLLTNQKRAKKEGASDWFTMDVAFQTSELEYGLLFLLQSDYATRQSPLPWPLTRDIRTESKSRRAFMAAELRNQTIWFMVQRDWNIWFEFALEEMVVGLHQLPVVLTVGFRIIRESEQRDGEKESWPIIRCRTSRNREWVYIGPLLGMITRLGRLNPNEVEKLTNSDAIELQKNAATPYDTGRYWFGNTLLLGGVNWTKSIEEGMGTSPVLHSLTGSRRNFVGCILYVNFDGIPSDLQSAVRARWRTKTATTLKQVLQLGCSHSSGNPSCTERSSLAATATATSENCENGGHCSEGWNRLECDCLRTMHTGTRCQEVLQILHFNGRQLIQLEFPGTQESSMDRIELAFNTRQPDALLLLTYSHRTDPKWITSMGRWRTEIKQSYNETSSLNMILKSGQIRIRYKTNGIDRTIPLARQVSDGQWHTIRLKRDGLLLTIELDGQKMSHELNLHNSILPILGFILGAPKSKSGSDFIGFVGKMAHVNINGISVGKNKRLSKWISKATTTTVHASSNPFQPVHTGSIGIYGFPVELKRPSCHVAQQRDSFSIESNYLLPLRFAFRARNLSQTATLMWTVLDQPKRLFIVRLVERRVGVDYYSKSGREKSVKIDRVLSDEEWHHVGLFRHQGDQNSLVVRVNFVSGANEEAILSVPHSSFHPSTGPIRFGDIPKTLIKTHFPGIEYNRGFQGCISDVQFGQGPIMDLLQSTSDDSTLGNESDHGCTTGCSLDDGTICDSGIKNEDGLEKRAGQECFNGEQCTQRWDDWTCDCSGTTFRGLQCSQIGAALRFGLKEMSVDQSAQNTHGFIRISCQEPSIVQHHPSTDFLVFGMQTMPEIQTMADLSSHGKRRMTLIRVDGTSGYFWHLFLVNGRLHVTWESGHLLGPRIRLDDGYYHRIRGIRRLDRIFLEVDNRTINHPVNAAMTPAPDREITIELAHNSATKDEDFFDGVLTGINVNGLKIIDHIEAMTRHTSIRVIQYGQVELLTKFQPNLPQPPSSKDHQEHRSTAIVPTRPSVSSFFNGSQSYLRMSPRIEDDFKHSPKINSHHTLSTARKLKGGSMDSTVRHRSKWPRAIRQNFNLWFSSLLLFIVITLALILFLVLARRYRSRRVQINRRIYQPKQIVSTLGTTTVEDVSTPPANAKTSVACTGVDNPLAINPVCMSTSDYRMEEPVNQVLAHSSLTMERPTSGYYTPMPSSRRFSNRLTTQTGPVIPAYYTMKRDCNFSMMNGPDGM